jgi:hypothetical protein
VARRRLLRVLLAALEREWTAGSRLRVSALRLRSSSALGGSAGSGGSFLSRRARGGRPLDTGRYRSPGVYVEEVPATPRPIEGVGTSTAGRVSDDPEKPEKPGKSAVPPAND